MDFVVHTRLVNDSIASLRRGMGWVDDANAMSYIHFFMCWCSYVQLYTELIPIDEDTRHTRDPYPPELISRRINDALMSQLVGHQSPLIPSGQLSAS